MNIPPKVLISSHQKRNVQGELPIKAPSPWLGPSDDIPDVGFPAFLQIMHAHFTELTYSREATHYARFRRKTDNPLDPEFRSYPIIAREQGTIVGHEQIVGLLKEFTIDPQKFRDAFNAFYELSPPA